MRGRLDPIAHLESAADVVRAPALAAIADQIESDDAYWEAVRFAWTESEMHGVHASTWRRLLTADRPGREALLPDGFDTLPDPLRLFRGFACWGRGTAGAHGFSWTLERSCAERLALRLFEPDDPTDLYVAIGTLPRARAIGYFGERGESEVLVMPEDVEVERIELLLPRKENP